MWHQASAGVCLKGRFARIGQTGSRRHNYLPPTLFASSRLSGIADLHILILPALVPSAVALLQMLIRNETREDAASKIGELVDQFLESVVLLKERDAFGKSFANSNGNICVSIWDLSENFLRHFHDIR